MKSAFVAALVVLAVAAGVFYGRRDRVPPAPGPSPAAVELVGATLLEGLGDYSFPVTTSSPEAQRWFNQGLMLTYGFNHDAAERSYLKAAELDPGLRDVLVGRGARARASRQRGMDPANNAKAWQRLQRAVALAPKATEREQAFIQRARRLVTRRIRREDRRPLDEAYAESTGSSRRQRPDDLDAAVFHAEAMMDLQPWDYYDDEAAAQGPHGRGRLAARVGHGAQPGPRRRAAPVRARGRGIRRPAARRGRGGPPARR